MVIGTSWEIKEPFTKNRILLRARLISLEVPNPEKALPSQNPNVDFKLKTVLIYIAFTELYPYDLCTLQYNSTEDKQNKKVRYVLKLR